LHRPHAQQGVDRELATVETNGVKAVRLKGSVDGRISIRQAARFGRPAVNAGVSGFGI
jgi:hypothetical protein